MKKHLLWLALLVAPASVAAPWLACDLDDAATHYAVQFCSTLSADGSLCITWGTWGSDQPRYGSNPPYACRHDLAGIAVGPHIVRASASATDAVWGRRESAPSAPLAFTRPGAATAPSGLRLSAQ